MPNGKLFGYNKLTNAQFEIGLIIEPFSLSDNLNDMPSNMKVRIVNNNREEYQVNTVCFHEDFDTWWVVKADTSTYLKTGEYEHELELVEYFEFFNYKHLITCAFKKDDYTFEQMVNRVFKLGGIVGFSVEYATFINKDRKNEFFSFENFTVASALKTLARSVNAIPKLKRVGGTPTLFFISRNGLDETPRTTMNSQFPIAFEKNANTSEQFQTRSISNLENVLSSDLVIAPRIGGYLATTKNASVLDTTNGVGSVILPSKIDRIDYIKLFPKITVQRRDTTPNIINKIYEGYYVDSKKIYDLIQSKLDINGSAITYIGTSNAELANIVMPSTEEFGKIRINDGLGNTYKDDLKPFAGYLTLKDSLLFRSSNQSDRNKTFYYEQRANELICSTEFVKGLEISIGVEEFNKYVVLSKKAGTSGGFEQVEIMIETDVSGLFSNKMNAFTTFIQVGYVPIGDLKVSYDNDNDAQDERFFNQSGKLLDSYAVSKLMFSHVQDSVEGTKIRQGRYTSAEVGNILPLGALISDSGIVYVVNQRSIDYVNDYYSVIYNLSRSRIARSENINADGSIREYAIPENNTVRRNQLFKDYFELSLETSTTTSTTPYINLERLLNLTSDYAGSRFNYQSFSKVKFSSQANKYIGVSTSSYDLYKAKSFVVDFLDNAIAGYRVEEVSGSAVQTPIIYTGTSTVNANTVGNGKVTELEVITTDEALLADNIDYYEDNATSVIPYSPFIDMTNVDVELYTYLKIRGGTIFEYSDATYGKDPFEIPVFTYQVQANDQYFPSNGTIVGERLFTDYNGGVNGVRYHYVVSTTKITSENADKIYTDNAPSSTTNKRVAFARPNQRQIDMTLYSTFSGTLNSTALQGKNIGIYAVDNTTTNPLPPKFLFAINNYQKTSDNAISVYINNWKI